jgi:hypothetical protein
MRNTDKNMMLWQRTTLTRPPGSLVRASTAIRTDYPSKIANVCTRGTAVNTILAVSVIIFSQLLTGCLRGETKLIDESNADFPFKDGIVLHQIYPVQKSNLFKNDQWIISINHGYYYLIYIHSPTYGQTSGPYLLKEFSTDKYIIADRSENAGYPGGQEYGALIYHPDGTIFLYKNFTLKGCGSIDNIDDEKIVRLKIRTDGNDCIVRSIDNLLDVMRSLNWESLQADEVYKITSESVSSSVLKQ